MSTESSTTKLLLSAHSGTSTSTTPTSSSPTPLSLNGDQAPINLNGNGILSEGKLSSTHYQNGILADLQTTFPNSSWSHGIDSMTAGDHPFDLQANNRMFEQQNCSPTPLMTMQQQVSYQQVSNPSTRSIDLNSSFQAVQRRPITAAHNFPTSQPIRSGGNHMPMNGRWNPQPSFMGPPPHSHQQLSPSSSSWNQPAIPHGFPSQSYVEINRSSPRPSLWMFRSRRPGPPLMNNPHISTGKGQNNPYSFLPPSSNPNPMRRTPVMGNYPTNNGSPMINGDLGQHFQAMNVRFTVTLSSLRLHRSVSSREIPMT